jgi:signal transduction histidine kinase
MNLKYLLTLFILLLSLGTFAEEPKDTAFANLYRRYLQLYSDSDETAFYDATEKMKAYYLEHNNSESYYKVWLNELLYDSEQGKSYRAIKKAGQMVKDMEEKNDKHYDIVYAALGNIYDTRGNYRMAKKYYNNALKACAPNDSGSLLSIYSRIASLQAHRESQKAWEMNEKMGKMAAKYPNYYKVYVVLKSEIAFYLKDKKKFEEAYAQYLQICKDHPILDEYGKDMMKMVHAAFHGDYDTAIEVLSHESMDFDPLDRCDMRIQVYEMMGNQEKALEEVAYRRDLRDSLNSDMLFESINEINAEMGLDKIEEEAHQKQEEAIKRQNLLLILALLFLVAALGLVISRNIMRRRHQKELMKQNKELEIALSRAEESDRMKDSFIEHVSHEIRTPLNIITGYAQVITNPEYELEDEERNRMLNDINKNTSKITYIVNELLEVAEDDSRQHYQKNDLILVNEFCRRIMGNAERINSGRLKMLFNSELNDDFVIHSNRRALEKVVEQLLNNAIKFTHTGFVELKVHESPDHGVVRFIITDSGIGIAEENQERVFDRFFKEDAFKQGFGLGLTMCRKMAILLGGSLFLDKEYKAGARFILTLPLVNDQILSS